MLCDPGDEVLVPAPAYPLLDLLADLEGVSLVRYPLRFDGEWHVDPLRTGETVDEEALALALLDDGVAVEPGFLYDFERRGHLVLSLLPPPATFSEGLARVRRRLCDAA